MRSHLECRVLSLGSEKYRVDDMNKHRNKTQVDEANIGQSALH
jgi:hypothetical protein